MNIELEIKDIKHDLNYAKKCEYDHVVLDVYKVQTLLTAYNDIKTEHKIMKRIIVENGLWERLLNDDEFIKHLEEE